MFRTLAPILSTVLVLGCGYVSKKKFDEVWDADGDGWGVDEDCDNANPNIYPFGPDVRGDGCDADCGEEVDADGDDWPESADCDDQDPNIFPCNPDEDEGDAIDSDCDGNTTKRLDACNEINDWEPHWGVDPDYAPATTAESTLQQTPIDPSACGVQ